LARRSAEDAEAELQMLAEERDGHSSALLDATAQLRDCLTSARAHAHARWCVMSLTHPLLGHDVFPTPAA
jgi:hypothetical protein